MSILKPPFNDPVLDLLYGMFTGGDVIHHEVVPVTYNNISSLGISNDLAGRGLEKVATYALIMLEADDTAVNRNKAVRFTEAEPDLYSNPDLNIQPFQVSAESIRNNGFPMGDMGTYDVKGIANMKNFRCTGTEEFKQHRLIVAYFG